MSFQNDEEALILALQMAEIEDAEAFATATKTSDAGKSSDAGAKPSVTNTTTTTTTNNNNQTPPPANNAKEGTKTAPTTWTIITTPGKGHQCGFKALIRSLKAQMPDLATPKAPTLQELTDTYLGSEAAALSAAVGQTNTDYYGVDQLAAMLYEWGQQHRSANLQLGCVVQGSKPLLLPTPTSGAAGVRVLWIHNDNAVEVMKKKWSHFSGLRLG